METVSVIFDTKYNTWNVMLGGLCIYYGTVDSVEDWLIEHEIKYKEEQ